MSYYVSVVDGTRRGLLVGPFRRHGDALRAVDATHDAVTARDSFAHFYGFGTCHDPRNHRPARHNALVGAQLDHDGYVVI